MFNRLVITSSLLLSSAITIAPAALAESVDINFSGVVPVQASFTTPTLGQTESIVASADKSISKFNTVIPAEFTVQSNTSTHISVSSPELTSGAATKSLGTGHTAALRFGSTMIGSDVSSDNISLPTGNSNLAMDLSLGQSEKLKPAIDTFLVIVTIAPN